jgi:hypothetical protein
LLSDADREVHLAVVVDGYDLHHGHRLRVPANSIAPTFTADTSRSRERIDQP